MKDEMSWQLIGLLTAMILVLLGVMAGPLFSQALPWMANTQTFSTAFADQLEVTLSYNSLHDEYLVVWVVGDGAVLKIAGIRVGSDGIPIGNVTILSPENGLNQFNPDVAYDAVNDQYLVVWTFDYYGDGSDYDVVGKFIPWNNLATGQAFQIDGRVGYQYRPAVVYTPETLNFYLVYQDDTSGAFEISGCTVAADGGSVGTVLGISGGLGGYRNARIAWNSRSQRYLVVYDGPPPDACGMAAIGRQLTSTGAPVAAEFNISSASYSEGAFPDVTSCRGNYLVSFSTADNGGASTYGCFRLISDLGLPSPTASCPTPEQQFWTYTSVDCSEGSGEYLLTWASSFSGTGWTSMAIMGAFIDSSGNAGDNFTLYGTPDDLDYYSPAVASGAGGKALVSWLSERPPSGGAWDIRGRLVGNILFADDFESGDTSLW